MVAHSTLQRQSRRRRPWSAGAAGRTACTSGTGTSRSRTSTRSTLMLLRVDRAVSLSNVGVAVCHQIFLQRENGELTRSSYSVVLQSATSSTVAIVIIRERRTRSPHRPQWMKWPAGDLSQQTRVLLPKAWLCLGKLRAAVPGLYRIEAACARPSPKRVLSGQRWCQL